MLQISHKRLVLKQLAIQNQIALLSCQAILIGVQPQLRLVEAVAAIV